MKFCDKTAAIAASWGHTDSLKHGWTDSFNSYLEFFYKNEREQSERMVLFEINFSTDALKNASMKGRCWCQEIPPAACKICLLNRKKTTLFDLMLDVLSKTVSKKLK